MYEFVGFLQELQKQKKANKNTVIVLVFQDQIISGNIVEIESGFETITISNIHRNEIPMTNQKTLTILCSSVIGWSTK